MPDIDPLAFGIRFALTRETIGREGNARRRSTNSTSYANRSPSIFGAPIGENGR